MTFRNDILAGLMLVRESIQSENFVAGSSGWSIDKDGHAEFNDIVIRGGQTIGSDFLAYNGTPAAGNLIFSLSAAGGTDPYGNVYPSGIATYGERAGTDYIANLVESFLTFAVVGQANPGFVGYSDLAPQYALELDSGNGGSSASSATISMVSESSSLSSDAAIELTADDVNVNGRLSVLNTAFTTYTPTIANGGTATFSMAKGYHYKFGDLRFVNIEFTVNAAGSGAAIVTVSLPTTPFRDGGTGRQVMPMHAKALWTAGMASDGCAVIMDTGSGAVIDQLATSNDNALNRDGIVTGANLLAGARATITGWYREV